MNFLNRDSKNLSVGTITVLPIIALVFGSILASMLSAQRSEVPQFHSPANIVDVEPESATQKYKKPSDAELKASLTPLQYRVTQRDATERPFANDYWNNKAVGIYVDVATGEPLFSSVDKFESGTGWPSFSRPLVAENVVTTTDYKLLISRTEVRSKHGDSHLGHVFNDGPKPTGKRYCINSASLRFVPKDNLESEGYGELVSSFEAAQ